MKKQTVKMQLITLKWKYLFWVIRNIRYFMLKYGNEYFSFEDGRKA